VILTNVPVFSCLILSCKRYIRYTYI